MTLGTGSLLHFELQFPARMSPQAGNPLLALKEHYYGPFHAYLRPPKRG
jgi:hypothetical protein